MEKNEFKFSHDELLTFLFKRKECPYCKNVKLIRRTYKVYMGSQRSTYEKMNLMSEDVYKNIFIYECEICKRKYTLKGLKDSIELSDVDNLLATIKDEDHNTSEKVQLSDKNGKLIIQKFANSWGIVAMLILLSIAIKNQNYKIIIIFAPFIILVYFILRFLGR